MRVLIVEDDAQVGYWLSAKLQRAGHASRLVSDGENALQVVGDEAFDAIILDRMLPGIDGIAVLNALKGKPHPPIMVLSAIDEPSARIAGLRAGADDYLGKPFDFSELLLRLEILVRRDSTSFPAVACLRISDLSIDYRTRHVTRADQHIELTEKEFELLSVLAENPGKTVTRAMLLEKVWGYQFSPQTNLIDVHVSKLRSKIDRDFATPLLRTIRSVGYVLG